MFTGEVLPRSGEHLHAPGGGVYLGEDVFRLSLLPLEDIASDGIEVVGNKVEWNLVGEVKRFKYSGLVLQKYGVFEESMKHSGVPNEEVFVSRQIANLVKKT